MPEQLSDLLVALLEGMVQPERCDSIWEVSVRELWHEFRHQLAPNPGLAALLEEQDWRAEIWLDVIAQVADETGVALLPETCPWSSDQVLNAAAGSFVGRRRVGQVAVP